MLLLPGAERERRALLLGGALAAGIASAWWPVAAVERAADRLVGWAAPPLARGAAWIADRVAPAPSPATATAAPPPGWLDEAERQRARPAPLAGLAWIEVPVLSVDRERGALRLGAGRTIGLAEGMVAACGGRYLGRLAEVDDDRSLLLHFRAADERTGVRLEGESGSIDGILIGRNQRPPVLMAEGGAPLAEGESVRFRGRASDPPPLRGAGLLLGDVAPFGDRARGEAAWVVEGELPLLAEGRVFVAAGALPAEPVPPPRPAEAPAAESLRRDGVFGERFCAFSGAGGLPAPPAVAERAGRVLGAAVRVRGGLAWVRVEGAAEWIERGEAVRPDEAAAHGWFTRGGGGIPRGLWLGAPGDPPPLAGEARWLAAGSARER